MISSDFEWVPHNSNPQSCLYKCTFEKSKNTAIISTAIIEKDEIFHEYQVYGCNKIKKIFVSGYKFPFAQQQQQ